MGDPALIGATHCAASVHERAMTVLKRNSDCFIRVYRLPPRPRATLTCLFEQKKIQGSSAARAGEDCSKQLQTTCRTWDLRRVLQLMPALAHAPQPPGHMQSCTDYRCLRHAAATALRNAGHHPAPTTAQHSCAPTHALLRCRALCVWVVASARGGLRVRAGLLSRCLLAC